MCVLFFSHIQTSTTLVFAESGYGAKWNETSCPFGIAVCKQIESDYILCRHLRAIILGIAVYKTITPPAHAS